MNSRIRTPFYIFFLNSDYVTAHSLRSPRSKNVKFIEFNTGRVVKAIYGKLQKPSLSTSSSLVWNQPRCHGDSTHLSQNARINPSVVGLNSCKKIKKYLNGELGIGT